MKLMMIDYRDGSFGAGYSLTRDDKTLFVCLPRCRGECLCLLPARRVDEIHYREEAYYEFLNFNSAELRKLGKLLVAIAIKHPRNKPVLAPVSVKDF